MAFRALLRNVRADEKGGAALVMALSAPVLMGAAGLAMDTVQWTMWRRQLQRSADSAALAGAFARAQAKSAVGAVNADLAKSLDVTLTGRTIENAPTAGPYAGDNRAVRVVLSVQQRLPFTSYFMSTPPLIRAEATAAVLSSGEYCVISLENTTETGITMQGSATVNLGCGIATNSVGSPAVEAGGSSVIKASPVAAVGAVPPSGNYATGTVLQPFSIAQQDPFADVKDPTLPAKCENKVSVNSNKTAELSEGCYRGMDLKGTVKLNPGTYYIDGGSFDVGAQAVITGSDVTIVLTSADAASTPSSIATVNINGGATISLSGGSTLYPKMLFYQDRRAPDSGSNKVNGNATSSFKGAFYFPGQALDFNGTSGMNTKCLQIVSRRVTFIGNSEVQNECDKTGDGPQAFPGTQIRLVG